MSYRLSKIYTKTGDDGTTAIGPKERLPKDHPRIELIGSLDELNSAIGLTVALDKSAEMKKTLQSIQQDLFNVGGELCPPFHKVITEEKVTNLETLIDTWNNELPPLTEFILPGGNPAAAACHLARTICRRTERQAVALLQDENFSPEILRYLNRLSDVLFVAARVISRETSNEEILWDHQRLKK